MKYLPTPEFAAKLSDIPSEKLGSVSTFLKFIDRSEKNNILKHPDVNELSDKIYVYKASPELRVLFTFLSNDEGEYLVVLDSMLHGRTREILDPLRTRFGLLSDRSRNPLSNHQLNPRSNAQLNPRYKGDINPKFNGQINPKFNGKINPKFNGQINPKFNGKINPKFNNALNPSLNFNINPTRNTTLDGPYVYDLTEQPIGFLVEVDDKMFLTFNMSSKWQGFSVYADNHVFCYYNNNNDWTEYWIVTPKKVFLRFNLDNEWIGFVG